MRYEDFHLVIKQIQTPEGLFIEPCKGDCQVTALSSLVEFKPVSVAITKATIDAEFHSLDDNMGRDECMTR